MKDKFLIFFLLMLFSQFIYSQNFDSVVLRCSYNCSYVQDTISPENKNYTMTLDIGKKISKYYSFEKMIGDSLLKADEAAGKGLSEMVNNRKKYNRGIPLVIYKNFPPSQITVIDPIIEQYAYTENLNPQNWIISQDTSVIIGFVCQKAIAHFRGRHYTAWFTKEIPFREGPWKFYGLPGLILKVSDSQNYFQFMCTGIEKINGVINFDNTKKYVKVTHKQLANLKKEFANDPIGFQEMNSGAIQVHTDIPIEQRKNYKKPFNPIERTDY